MPSSNNYNSVHVILGIFVAFAIMELSPGGDDFVAKMVFNRAAFLEGEVWRIFTYAFLQNLEGSPGNLFWLFIHILVFLYLASPLESLWGTRFFLTVFAVSVLGGAATGMFFNLSLSGSWHIDLTIMLLHGFLFPESSLLLFFILPVKVKHLAIFATLLLLLGAFSTGIIYGLCLTAGLLSGVVYYLLIKRVVPGLETTRKFIEEGGPQTMLQEKKAIQLFDKGMTIADKMKNDQASAEEIEWVENLDQDIEVDFEICSPYTYDPKSKICPPCPAFQICLKRHIKNKLKE